MSSPLAEAFAGIRVLDLSQNLPGPLATAILAAAGAEVVKIEPPWGEPARHLGRLFERVNAGKRSLALDLREPHDRAVLERLITAADVLVESFRPGVLGDFGFAPAAVCAGQPRLVWCSISGWGQATRRYPAHDLDLQAASGLTTLLGRAEGRPRAAALPIADLSAAHTAVAAIATALFARERSGEGALLDLALADTVVAWTQLWNEAMDHRRRLAGESLDALRTWLGGADDRRLAGIRDALATALGLPPLRLVAAAVDEGLGRSRIAERIRELGLFALPHYGLFRCADDRFLALAIVDEERFWKRLCDHLELGHLASLPLAVRVLAGQPIRRALGERLATRDRAHWLVLLDELPVAPVAGDDELDDFPPLAARLPKGAAARPFDLDLPPLGPLGGDRDAVLADWLAEAGRGTLR